MFILREIQLLIYSRKETNRIMRGSRTEIVIVITGAWVWGFAKLDFTPGGGGFIGVWLRSIVTETHDYLTIFWWTENVSVNKVKLQKVPKEQKNFCELHRVREDQRYIWTSIRIFSGAPGLKMMDPCYRSKPLHIMEFHGRIGWRRQLTPPRRCLWFEARKSVSHTRRSSVMHMHHLHKREGWYNDEIWAYQV